MMESKTKRRERLDRGIRVRTTGLYGLLSYWEISYLVIPRLVLIVGLLILPLLITNEYWEKVICLMMVNAMLALVFDFLAEFVGLICLGGALFEGVGAYMTALFNNLLHLPVAISILLATVGGGIFCTVLLLPCLPLRGIYFAIVTFIYPLLAARIINALDVLGGTTGLFGLTGFPNIWFDQYIIITGSLVSLFAIRKLVGQDVGLVLRGIRDNDQAIRACGMNIIVYKAMAVFIGSGIGCFVGAYIAHLYQWAGLSLFALDFSIMPIAASIVGGLGTLAGPMLGAIFLTPLSELLRTFGGLRITLYAFVLVCFVLFRTEGILNYAQRKYHQFERWIEV